jgi:chromosome segregation protein
VTLIRVQVATLTEQHESCQRSIADIEKQQGDLTRRIGSDREQLEKGVKEREQLQEAIVAGAEKMETIVRQHVVAEQRLAEVRSAHDAALERLAGCEEAARQARDAKDEVRQTQAELNLKFSTLSLQAESLERGILDRSRISMPEALQRLERSDFDEEARRQRKVELQRLLDEMGEVNLMAIEECAEMEQRFEFLSAQKDDLKSPCAACSRPFRRSTALPVRGFRRPTIRSTSSFRRFPASVLRWAGRVASDQRRGSSGDRIDIIVQPPARNCRMSPCCPVERRP